MKKTRFPKFRNSLLIASVMFLTSISGLQAQNYYSQWTGNLAAGDNIFDITTGTTFTNWATNVQAITPELLANSVTVNVGGDNVNVLVKKLSATQFKVNSASAISGAVITAQYPGVVVNCTAPTLISVVRNGTTATYTWNNNGMPFTAISLEYSTDGGVTWSGNTGSPVSPRSTTVPATVAIQFRVTGYASAIGCPSVTSNIISLSYCPAPTLVSATRNSSTPSTITFTWNNNGGTYNTILMEYSTDGGTTWSSGCAGSAVSPRTCTGYPTWAILVRLHAYGGGCDSVSNSISLTTMVANIGTQAVSAIFTDPKNLGCGSICSTFGTTNFTCSLLTDVSNAGVGTQLYINNTSGQPVPATSANCAAFGNAAGTSCNLMQNGVKWIRFVSSNVIWNVNPSTGIISGTNLTCP